MRYGRSRLAPLALVLLGLAAADRAGAQAYWGGQVGGSFANFGGERSEGLDSYRGAFAAGALAGWRRHPALALQVELSWLRKGARGTLQGFEEPIAVDIRLDYLQLPVLVRASLPALRSLRPVLSAGAAVSFETACDVRTAPSELALTLGCEDGGGREGRRTKDWSVLVGAGAEYDLGIVVLGVDGRYDFGLVNLEPPGPRNRAFVITTGVRVPLQPR